MASLSDGSVRELTAIRNILLSPTTAALWDCERRLSNIIFTVGRTVGEARERYSKSSDFMRLIADIQRLLENAKRFWDDRQAVRGPGRRYSHGGSLSLDSFASTFAIEV